MSLFSRRILKNLHETPDSPKKRTYPRARIPFMTKKEKTLCHEVGLPLPMLQKKILGKQSLMLPDYEIIGIIESYLP